MGDRRAEFEDEGEDEAEAEAEWRSSFVWREQPRWNFYNFLTIFLHISYNFGGASASLLMV
jgi:hypothetical protein